MSAMKLAKLSSRKIKPVHLTFKMGYDRKPDDFANINFDKLQLHEPMFTHKLRYKSFSFSSLLKNLVFLAKQKNLNYREENIERNLNLVLKYFEISDLQRKILKLIYKNKSLRKRTQMIFALEKKVIQMTGHCL